MNIPEPSQHIDRLIVQTRQHHVQLSAMADVKANIMLTLASVVVTILFRYLTDPVLRWPAAVNLIFCFVTILMSAYAVMPKIRLRNGQANKTSHNILFFGNFVNMDFDEYSDALEKTFLDHNKIYETQVREVYELGVFLETNKYRFIRYAYISFISGLIASGIVFVLVGIFG